MVSQTAVQHFYILLVNISSRIWTNLSVSKHTDQASKHAPKSLVTVANKPREYKHISQFQNTLTKLRNTFLEVWQQWQINTMIYGHIFLSINRKFTFRKHEKSTPERDVWRWNLSDWTLCDKALLWWGAVCLWKCPISRFLSTHCLFTSVTVFSLRIMLVSQILDTESCYVSCYVFGVWR